jgi:two-component system NarL family response regulator
MSIRILIAEDQRMVREMLTLLLRRESDFELVGEAGTGGEAIALATTLRPDMLVLDIGLPDIEGFQVARSLRSTLPELKMLVLSVHTGRHFVQQMLKAGAEGYVVKSSALQELVQAIRVVAQGKIYLSPDITREALSDDAGDEISALGSRERQVLSLLAEGKRSQEIAGRLHISAATVDAHRRNIMRKLGLHTIAELTKYAIRKGLTSL